MRISKIGEYSMRRKNLSIYATPKRYAKKCGIPLSLAKIECRKQKKITKMRKHIICPICKRNSLYYEHGSYEEGYDAFIECSRCGETYDPVEIRNSEYLTYGYDFDAVLYFSSGRTKEEKIKNRIEAIGTTDDAHWIEFAKKMILGE